jgi:hypothetical protein
MKADKPKINPPHAFCLKSNVAVCFFLLSSLAYTSTLKMKGVCWSETSEGFYWTIRRYIPEDITVHCHLKSSIKIY